MNIIEIVPKNTFKCNTISAFTSYFENSDYSLLTPNRLVPVQLFLDKLKKICLISTSLYNSPEKTVKQFTKLNKFHSQNAVYPKLF